MKKFIKITSFILIVAVIYLYMGMVFMPKTITDAGGSKYYGAISYKYEPKNSIDVMFYGNSDVYSGISPMEIYRKTGITSYGCGAAKQTLRAIYKQLKFTLRTQTPKVAVIDADCFYQANPPFGGTEMYDYAIVAAPFLYHSRWKELKPRDFVTFPTMNGKDNFLKGYHYSDKVYDYKVKDDFMADLSAMPKPLKKSVLKDFKKIHSLCRKNGIALSLITIPSPVSWDNAKSNGIKKLVSDYNKKFPDFEVGFYDMNLKLDGFDYSRCFRDRGNHCNYDGAMIVTSAVGQYLKDNYPSLHNPPERKNWHRLLGKYDDFIKNRNVQTVYEHK